MKTARKVKNLRRNWYKGTALYELSEPKEISAMGFLTETRFVIMAFTPEAVDHGCSETTVFAANKDGQLFGGFWDRSSSNPADHVYVEKLTMDGGAEFSECRVVAAYDPRLALQKLGYEIEYERE